MRRFFTKTIEPNHIVTIFNVMVCLYLYFKHINVYIFILGCQTDCKSTEA